MSLLDNGEDPNARGIDSLEKSRRITIGVERQEADWKNNQTYSYSGGGSGGEVLVTSLGEMIRFRCWFVWAAIFALIYYSGWLAAFSSHSPSAANGSFVKISLTLATGICLTSPTARRWMFRKLLFVLLLAAVGFIFIVGYSMTHPAPVQMPQAQPPAHHSAHKIAH